MKFSLTNISVHKQASSDPILLLFLIINNPIDKTTINEMIILIIISDLKFNIEVIQKKLGGMKIPAQFTK